jgi:hypothetical protein
MAPPCVAWALDKMAFFAASVLSSLVLLGWAKP